MIKFIFLLLFLFSSCETLSEVGKGFAMGAVKEGAESQSRDTKPINNWTEVNN